MSTKIPTLLAVLSTGLACGLLISHFMSNDVVPQPEPGLSPGGFDATSLEDQARSAAAMNDLAMELATLRARVEQLERPSKREATPVDLTTEDSAELASEGSIPSADERAKILTVLAQRDEERAHERELQRAEKQQAEHVRQATRIANKLQLPTGSEERMASIFQGEQEQVALVREQYKDVGRGGDGRKAFKDALAETRSWRDEELTLYFGAEVASEITSALDGKRKDRKSDKKRSKQKDSAK